MNGESGKNLKWLAAAGVLIAGVAIAFWSLRSPKPPPPTADVATLAKFVRTDAYKKLPEDQKRPYMKSLRKGMAQLADARNQGQISQNDYEAGYLNAYLERKLDDMDEFFKIPEAKRKQVLLAEYVKKNRTKPATAASSSTPPHPAEDKEEHFVDHRVEKWPPEERAKWEQYRHAIKEAKEAAKNVK